MRNKRISGHSNSHLDEARDMVLDSCCNLKLATPEDVNAAWKGCRMEIKKWLKQVLDKKRK
jgi:hypothetical protein